LKKLIILVGLFLLNASAFAGIRVNEPAPLFSAKDLEGNNFNLADVVGVMRKEPVQGVMMSFFASWCIPCRNELPLINSLTDELKRKGIKIVIVNVKEDEQTIKTLLGDLKVSKPLVLFDHNGKISEEYGIRFLPVTFFVGADGNVKSVIYGEIENKKKLMDSVDKIAK